MSATLAEKLAAWARKLDEADARLVLDAIREHGRARRQAGEDAMADACVRLGVELQQALGLEDASVDGARLAAQRMPRRQLKGTCPPVEAGQKREGMHDKRLIIWTIESRSSVQGDWACSGQGFLGYVFVPEWKLAQMPLAEDFGPSDLAGLAKREAQPEPRVWRAGTVPPVLEVGMVFLHPGTAQRLKVTGVDLAGQMHLELPGGEGAGWWTMHDGWKLADDFPIPEDA